MRVMISIDWDFFLWRAFEAKVDKAERHLIGLYDWGHSEHHSPTFQSILWRSRWQAFGAAGLVPRDWTGVRLSQGGVPWETFLHADLAHRYDLRPATLYLGDSHTWGYFAARDGRPAAVDGNFAASRKRRGKLHVVHFDAHHDLGYGAGALRERVRTATVDCESWLYLAARDGYVASIDVVFPTWVDIEHARPSAKVPKGVSLRLWSYADWLKATQTDTTTDLTPVEVVNVARSSAWTPPWFDSEFDTFIRSLPVGKRRCVDCEYAKSHPDEARGHDACTPREFDEDAADREVAMLRAAQLDMRKAVMP